MVDPIPTSLKGSAKTNFETPLSSEQEKGFQTWKAQNAPNDTGADYDFRGAYLAGLKPSEENGHWPDTYKKPNHSTFSNESQYAQDAIGKAGRWEGETYIPPTNAPAPASLSGAGPLPKLTKEQILPESKAPLPSIDGTTTPDGTYVSYAPGVKIAGRDKGAEAPKLDPYQADLFDMKSGQRIVAKDHQDLESGIRDGRYGYGDGKLVNIIDDEGELKHVESKYLKWSLGNGYKIETPEAAAVRQYLDEHKGLSGDAQVALGQFADEALLGIPELILDETQDPLDLAKREAIKKDHAVANTIGGVVGSAASLELGSPLFKGASVLGKGAEAAITGQKVLEGAKALEVGAELAKTGMRAADIAKVAPGLARSIIGKGVGLGVEGAVISSPKAITEAALGDPDEAAETLMHGFGLSSAFGVAGSLVSKGAEAVAPKIGSLRGLAEEQAFKNLGGGKKFVEAASELSGGKRGIGGALLDNGLVRGINEHLEDYAARINTAREETGNKISDLYSKIDGIAAGKTTLTSGEELASRLRSKVISPLSKIPGNKPIISKLEAYVSDFESVSGKEPLGFKQLHDFRTRLDEILSEGGSLSTNKELSKVRDIITKELETKGDRLAKKVNFPWKQGLDDASLLYNQLKIAHKAAETSALAKQVVGSGDHGLGFGVLGSVLTGNPLSLVKSVGASIAGSFVKENQASMLAKALNYLAGKSEQKGLLITESAMKKAAKHMDRVPSILSKLATGAKNRGTGIALAGAMRAIDHRKVASGYADMMNDPQALQQAATVLSDSITNGGAPTIGTAYQQKQLAALNYLSREVPKPPAPQSAFVADKWKPGTQEAAGFARKVEVASDWTKVLDHLEKGDLHADHVAAFQATSPKLAARLTARVKQYELSGEAKALPFQARKQLSLLTGETYGMKAGSNAGFFQTVYSKQPTQASKASNKGLTGMPGSQGTSISALSDSGYNPHKKR